MSPRSKSSSSSSSSATPSLAHGSDHRDHRLPNAAALDLSALPPVFVLATHMSTEELVGAEDLLRSCGVALTYDAAEARLFLGRVQQKRRAVLELRQLGVSAVEDGGNGGGSRKRRRWNGGQRAVVLDGSSSTESGSEAQSESEARMDGHARGDGGLSPSWSLADDRVLVARLAWLEQSIARARCLPLHDFVVYEGRRQTAVAIETPVATPAGRSTAAALAKRPRPSNPSLEPPRHSRAPAPPPTHRARRPALLHETTSEHDVGASHDLPPLPEWALRRSTYSCERATPADPPNAAFIAQLLTIRTARKLTGDEIGVRAYSTAIAAIAAYPHTVTAAREIVGLPGCEGKIGSLWSEWRSKNACTEEETQRGRVLIDAAREAEGDARLRVLRLFYEIWGVGAASCRQFYDNGWRDLDDVVEYGWSQLSRVQQIGVKYYDDFQRKIPRAEVESIAATIRAAAREVARDAAGVRTVVVGGYRRGKTESGDVDVIVSHVDESETIDFVQRIVARLVHQGWITHELITTTAGSRRGQATLPFRGDGGGHGFDTLDKSLVVWQDPGWEGSEEVPDMSKDEKRRKNPNVHRRVDIIIAPWGKIGCAVLGWTAGTTFERDLRRYAKKEKHWKFDSSGVRDRNTGLEVDLQGECQTAEEAERKVFQGLGLVYREPWERCTE